MARKVKVAVGQGSGRLVGAGFERVAKEALANFINNLDIAKTITQPLLSKALIKIVGSDFNIDDLQFSKKGESLAYLPIKLKLNEIATISLDNIEVIKA